ncbi:ATP-grasp fold domain protein, DUF201-type [Spirochaeta thermophila DSM 6578]|uniref:ATP-grasp fold domain protein, DUF201-type n=1 Tax=Winmispira thermophila (strain ATCC 700085 / DSM 6578 / Z-1203) TaxID=869211 RepID=G0GCW9_WINT7|nr:ATP-grasp domain-containing protein [Spirochaeta thermophila]AEJ61261.1 ATP-grasp fold domain protein, DUF201-type [Spirochaeta thermophila DSM 6578]
MEDQKTVLILGAGVMQLPAIKIARRLGWRVAVADADPSAPGARLADLFFHVDLKDTEGLLAAARKLASEGGLHGVFTAGTDFSTSVAYVAERMGLPGIPYEVALRAKDKALMREHLHRAGIPVPRYAVLSREERANRLLEEGRRIPFPLVVKPADNMGARGVRLVRDTPELEEAVESAAACSLSGKVVLEEFLEGPEFSIDAVVWQGEVHICGVADRHIFFPPYFVEMGHTMPTDIPPSVRAELEEVFVRAVKALGITEGAAKGDVFYTGRGPVIGEIAARLSGGYMSGWTYPYASGVDVTEAALRIAVGLPPGDLSPRWQRVCAERAFLSIPGVIRDIEGFHLLRLEPGVKKTFLRISPGDRVRFPTNNVEKCGNVLALGGTREEAVSRAEESVSRVRLVLLPGDAETSSFLFEDTSFPSAFSLDPQEEVHLSRLSSLYRSLPRVSPPYRVRKVGLNAYVDILPLRVKQDRDWYYHTIGEILEEMDTYLASVSPLPWILGRDFWAALLKGGWQGARWYVDTLRGGVDPRTLEPVG